MLSKALRNAAGQVYPFAPHLREYSGWARSTATTRARDGTWRSTSVPDASTAGGRTRGTTMPRPQTKLELTSNCITEPPVYRDHERTRNWAATVRPDPTVQGGMRRDFWTRGPRFLIYIVPQLPEHAVVEFGADYVSTGGNRTPQRWYGVLVRQESQLLVLERATDFLEAWRRAERRR